MRRLDSRTRLLLRLPSWLGDFVMAEPALAACAAALEEGRLAALSLAAPPRFLELLEGRFEGVRRLAEDESWRAHDAALFLDGSLRSLWRAARAGIGERWSWFDGGRFALATGGFWQARERGATPPQLGARGRGRRRLPRPFGASCAELLGAAGVAVIERAPRLASGAAARERARARLARLGLAPGEAYLALDASARPGSAKAPPPELWAEVLAELEAGGAPHSLLLTAPGEQRAATRIAQLAPAGAALVCDPPPDLAELAALLEGAALFLGADSGPRHLAAALGSEVLVLFGPSDPRHTADHGACTTRFSARVDCGPCHRERCPQPDPFQLACFRDLLPAAVARAVLARGDGDGGGEPSG